MAHARIFNLAPTDVLSSTAPRFFRSTHQDDAFQLNSFDTPHAPTFWEGVDARPPGIVKQEWLGHRALNRIDGAVAAGTHGPRPIL